MPDFAPNFTARLRVRYNVSGANHSATWRYPGNGDGPELGAILVAAANFYNAMGNALYDDFQFLGNSYATRGSNIFIPTDPIAFTVTPPGDSTTRRPKEKATVASFVGRTDAGLRAILYLYGTVYGSNVDSTSDDFRIFIGEDGAVNSAVNSLIASGADIVGNDGNPINWYGYANWKFDDYWLRKVRNG